MNKLIFLNKEGVNEIEINNFELKGDESIISFELKPSDPKLDEFWEWYHTYVHDTLISRRPTNIKKDVIIIFNTKLYYLNECEIYKHSDILKNIDFDETDGSKIKIKLKIILKYK